mgnify:CR=1 FL=1
MHNNLYNKHFLSRILSFFLHQPDHAMENTNDELFASLRKQFKQYKLFKPIWVQRCTKYQDVLTNNGYLSLYPGLYAYKTDIKAQSFDVMSESKLTAFYRPSNITDGNWILNKIKTKKKFFSIGPWKRYNPRQDAPGASYPINKSINFVLICG